MAERVVAKAHVPQGSPSSQEIYTTFYTSNPRLMVAEVSPDVAPTDVNST